MKIVLKNLVTVSFEESSGYFFILFSFLSCIHFYFELKTLTKLNKVFDETLPVNRCRTEFLQSFNMVGGAIPFIGFKAVSGKNFRIFHHKSVPCHLSDDTCGSDRNTLCISFNDRDLGNIDIRNGDRIIKGDAKSVSIAAASNFDSWTEYFDYAKWLEAFAEAGVDIDSYTTGKPVDEILPWDFIENGVRREYLERERDKAYNGETTSGCTHHCNGCGANKLGRCFS